MEFTTWLIYVGVALVAIISPGPATLLTISNSLRYGTRSIYLSTLGNETGVFLLSLSAILGLGLILQTSTSLFLLVKIIGAIYLIYLGIRQWRSKNNIFTIEDKQTIQQPSNKRFFVEGFLIAATNPKAILFFTALFPQFIDLEKPLISQFFIMTFTFMVISFLSLIGYGKLAFKAKHWFSTSRRIQWFNRTIGSLFILIGAALLQLKVEKVSP